MIDYDPSKPLVFNHIPKCAGSTLTNILKKSWKGDYIALYNTPHGYPPILKAEKYSPGSIIVGHFLKNANAIEAVHDNGFTQFISIFRDPFATTISKYFYQQKRRNFRTWPFKTKVKWIIQNGFSLNIFKKLDEIKKAMPEQSLEEFLLNPRTSSEVFLKYLPEHINEDNYQEYFDKNYVFVGVSNDLLKCLQMIAKKTGQNLPFINIKDKNVGKYSYQISKKIKQDFINRNKLSYLIYEYSLRRMENEYKRGII